MRRPPWRLSRLRTAVRRRWKGPSGSGRRTSKSSRRALLLRAQLLQREGEAGWQQQQQQQQQQQRGSSTGSASGGAADGQYSDDEWLLRERAKQYIEAAVPIIETALGQHHHAAEAGTLLADLSDSSFLS